MKREAGPEWVWTRDLRTAARALLKERELDEARLLEALKWLPGALEWLVTVELEGIPERPPASELSPLQTRQLVDLALAQLRRSTESVRALNKELASAMKGRRNCERELDRLRKIERELVTRRAALSGERERQGRLRRRLSAKEYLKTESELSQALEKVRTALEIVRSSHENAINEYVRVGTALAALEGPEDRPSEGTPGKLDKPFLKAIRAAAGLIPLSKANSGQGLVSLLQERLHKVQGEVEQLRADSPSPSLQQLITKGADKQRASREAKKVEREAASKQREMEARGIRRDLDRQLADEALMTRQDQVDSKRLTSLKQQIARTREQIERTTAQRLANWPSRLGWVVLGERRKYIAEHRLEFPQIDNLHAKLTSLEKEIAEAERRKQKLLAARDQIAKTERRLRSTQPPGRRRTNSRPSMVVYDWTQAEVLAREHLQWLGFSDAKLTGAGADGGVDVRSSQAVAQVKMHNKGTGRPDVQQLFGIAAAERRTPLMFAMSYTREAISWAQEHDIALFRFARTGGAEPVTDAAKRLDRSA